MKDLRHGTSESLKGIHTTALSATVISTRHNPTCSEKQRMINGLKTGLQESHKGPLPLHNPHTQTNKQLRPSFPLDDSIVFWNPWQFNLWWHLKYYWIQNAVLYLPTYLWISLIEFNGTYSWVDMYRIFIGWGKKGRRSPILKAELWQMRHWMQSIWFIRRGSLVIRADGRTKCHSRFWTRDYLVGDSTNSGQREKISDKTEVYSIHLASPEIQHLEQIFF